MEYSADIYVQVHLPYLHAAPHTLVVADLGSLVSKVHVLCERRVLLEVASRTVSCVGAF